MRPDFYWTIHKAIRCNLSGLLLDTATAGPDPTAWHALGARLGTTAFVLEEHARHEERFIHPLLARHAGAVAARIQTEHVALDTRLRDVRTAFAEVERFSRGDHREPIGCAYRALSGFAAAYFSHMEIEETEAMPALWRAMSDAELLEVHGALIASIEPGTLRIFLTMMLPAINDDERIELLSGVQAGAPPEAFESVMALAKNILPKAAFDVTRAAVVEGSAS
jgi:hypothetical protein